MESSKLCRKCGKPFKRSASDSTVNCPNCRNRPTAETFTPRPLDREALGHAHGMAGKPRLATGMVDYHRGYDRAVTEREEA